MTGEYECLADAILANQEFMEKGKGEGLICVSKHETTKWKIGAYPDNRNEAIIKEFVQQIEADKELLGEHTEKALEVFDVMKRVQGSKQQVFPPGSDEDYMEAIKSAMSKFDSHESFEVDEYYEMIVKETTEDIAGMMGEAFKAPAHAKKVKNMLKQKFKIMPKKQPKGKKNENPETKDEK